MKMLLKVFMGLFALLLLLPAAAAVWMILSVIFWPLTAVLFPFLCLLFIPMCLLVFWFHLFRLLTKAVFYIPCKLLCC